MKSLMWKVLLPFLAVFVFAAPALAATVSGTITTADGADLGDGGMEVRLWGQTPKGYSISYEMLTSAGGAFSFTDVDPGNYKVSARIGPGISAPYGDTWYDVEDPYSEGIFGSDADVLEIDAGDVVTGIDIELPITGGFHGSIHGPTNTPVPDVWVRAESRTDHRHHHNDLTKNYMPRHGEFFFRGLRQTHDFRIIVFDPSGAHETLILPDSLAVNNEAHPDVGTFQMVAMGDDPNEPNNTAQEATEITDLPFESNEAIITPRGSDVDWYCLDVESGDRLLARASSRLDVDGDVRPHPWIDPIMSFWTGDGSQMLLSNDDAPGESTRDSFIDTDFLEAGRYCFVVSTYGDQDWQGTGQESAGRYTLEVEMGNRPPFIEVTFEQDPAPRAPETLVVEEGDDIVLELVYGDPDGDPLDLTVTHVNNNGDDVDGELIEVAGVMTYQWSVSETAAHNSPHELTFSVDDGDLSAEYPMIVEVDAVNFPPTTPIPYSPIDDVQVNILEVPLVVFNATDPDGDDLVYEFEIHEAQVAGDPDQWGNVDENSNDSQTTWTTGPLSDNTTVYWRVRAFDGDTNNGYSPWSEWELFFVDTDNDPPGVPQIVKPTPNQIVLVPTPRISSTLPDDPDGDPVSILFEVAEADDADVIVAESDAVPGGSANTVEWTVDPALLEGESYLVRARAIDDRGGQSAWSDTVRFRVRAEGEAVPPYFEDHLDAQCYDGGLDITAPLHSVTVLNIPANGEALNFHLQVRRDGSTVYENTVAQSDGTETEIAIDADTFSEEGHYTIRVRTLIGEDTSQWTECSAFSAGYGSGSGDGTGDGSGDGSGGDGQGSDDYESTGEAGCFCSASGSHTQGAGWFAFLLMLAVGYRVRRS